MGAQCQRAFLDRLSFMVPLCARCPPGASGVNWLPVSADSSRSRPVRFLTCVFIPLGALRTPLLEEAASLTADVICGFAALAAWAFAALAFAALAEEDAGAADAEAEAAEAEAADAPAPAAGAGVVPVCGSVLATAGAVAAAAAGAAEEAAPSVEDATLAGAVPTGVDVLGLATPSRLFTWSAMAGTQVPPKPLTCRLGFRTLGKDQ